MAEEIITPKVAPEDVPANYRTEVARPATSPAPGPSSRSPSASSMPLPQVKLFVCHCLTEPGKRKRFTADGVEGKCPCGLEIKDPRNVSTIFQCEIIHLDPPTGFNGRGHGFAVCDPSIKCPGGKDTYFTGEWSAATCPLCLETEVYKKLAAGGPVVVPTEADYEWKPPVKPTDSPE